MCLSAQANQLKGIADGSSAAHASPPNMRPILQHMDPRIELPRFSKDMDVQHIMASTIETTGRNPFDCGKAYTQPQAWMHQTSGFKWLLESKIQILDLCFAANHKSAPPKRGQKLTI